MKNMQKDTSDRTVTLILSNRYFRHLWAGQIFSQIAVNTLIFVLAIRVYSLTGSNTSVSFLYLLYGIPALFFGIAAGSIVSKLESRTVLVFCDLSRFILSLGFLVFHRNVPFLYVFTLINSIISQFYTPVQAPTIPRLVDKSAIMTANSLFSFTYFSSLALGSLLAGPFLKFLGTTGTFICIALSFAFAAWNSSKIPFFGASYSRRNMFSVSPTYFLKRLIANITDGIRYVKTMPTLRESITLLLGTQVILAVLGTLGPGFAVKVLDIEVHDASIIIMGPTVLGIVLGALWVGNFGYRIASRTLINTGIFMAGSVLILVSIFAWASGFPISTRLVSHQLANAIQLVLFFVLGIGNSLLDVPANTVLQSSASDSKRSLVYGLFTTAVGGIGILPVILGGIMADLVGTGTVILVMGIGIVGYGCYRLVTIRTDRIQ